MSETNNSGDKTLSANPPPKPTLHLKRPVEQGTVRQSFSHGRSKAVVVEKVKRRVVGPGEAPAQAAPVVVAKPTAATAAPAAAAPVVAPRGPTTAATIAPPKTGVVLRTLTEEQVEARARALLDARAREEEDRRRQEGEARERAEREARERAEREAAEARRREEDTRRAQDAAFKRQSEEEARRRLGGGEPAATPATALPRKVGVAAAAATPAASAASVTPAARPAAEQEEAPRSVVRRPAVLTPAAKIMLPTPRPNRGGEQRNRGRLTVASATSGEEERMRSVAAFRRRTQRLKGHGQQEAKDKISREIVLPETITVQELANRMSERAVDVIKLLMRQGRMVTLTDTLDADTAEIIAGLGPHG